MSYSFTNGEFSGTASSGFGYPFTLACWVKYSSFPGNFNGIVGWGVSPTSNDHSGQIRTGDATTEDFRAYSRNAAGDSASQYGFTNGTYDDLWVPVIATFDTATSRVIYVELFSQSGSNAGSRVLTGTPDEIVIGRRFDATNPFVGNIAEVGISNSTWSQAQIEAFMAGGVVTTIDSGAFYYSLATDDDTPADESGNGGPTLALSGTADFASDHPTIGGAIFQPFYPIRVNPLLRM